MGRSIRRSAPNRFTQTITTAIVTAETAAICAACICRRRFLHSFARPDPERFPRIATTPRETDCPGCYVMDLAPDWEGGQTTEYMQSGRRRCVAGRRDGRAGSAGGSGTLVEDPLD